MTTGGMTTGGVTTGGHDRGGHDHGGHACGGPWPRGAMTTGGHDHGGHDRGGPWPRGPWPRGAMPAGGHACGGPWPRGLTLVNHQKYKCQNHTLHTYHTHLPTCAWYFKSFLILPVVKFQTSTNPSALPVTKYCPSGEKAADSGYDLVPNLMVLVRKVGYFSSSRSLMAARPLEKPE